MKGSIIIGCIYLFGIKIAQIVQATYHGRDPAELKDFYKDFYKDKLHQIAHDVDLEVLSWPRERYFKYTRWVKEEYKECMGLSEKEWHKNRSMFLKSMLSREKIYLTDEFAYLETAARENMKAELDNLFLSENQWPVE